MFRFEVITLFPQMFQSPLAEGVVGQALQSGLFAAQFHNPREFALNRYGSVDDRPYGGGEGMLLSALPLKSSLQKIKNEHPELTRVVLLGPAGRPFTQALAREYSQGPGLILVCGRYEGVDQRFVSEYVDEEVSIGDYVLSGGEPAAMVLMDTVARLLPGVLGNSLSSEKESFQAGLLEHPQFTRPSEFEGLPVPRVLTSGDHAKIDAFKNALSMLVTWARRPDLLAGGSGEAIEKALQTYRSLSAEERKSCGLPASESEFPGLCDL